MAVIGLIQARLGRDVWGLVRAYWEQIWRLQERKDLVNDIGYYSHWADFFCQSDDPTMHAGCLWRTNQLTNNLFELAGLPNPEKNGDEHSLSQLELLEFRAWEDRRIKFYGCDDFHAVRYMVRAKRSHRRLR